MGRVGPPHAPVEAGHPEEIRGEVEQQGTRMFLGETVDARAEPCRGCAKRGLLLLGDDPESAIRWVVVERALRHLGLVK